MKIKIKGLKLHVSFAHKLAHTNVLQKRQLQQKKKKTALLQTRVKSTPSPEAKNENKTHAYICIKCYYLTQMLFLEKV